MHIIIHVLWLKIGPDVETRIPCRISLGIWLTGRLDHPQWSMVLEGPTSLGCPKSELDCLRNHVAFPGHGICAQDCNNTLENKRPQPKEDHHRPSRVNRSMLQKEAELQSTMAACCPIATSRFCIWTRGGTLLCFHCKLPRPSLWPTSTRSFPI